MLAGVALAIIVVAAVMMWIDPITLQVSNRGRTIDSLWAYVMGGELLLASSGAAAETVKRRKGRHIRTTILLGAIGSAIGSLCFLAWMMRVSTLDVMAGRLALAALLAVQVWVLLNLGRLTKLRESADSGIACPNCGYDLRGTPVLEGRRGRTLRQCPECQWIALPD